jgi:hypothetical protein
MPTDRIQESIRFEDLSDRFAHSEAVVASPAAAAETIIASVQLAGGIPIVSGVLLFGWAALTVGTDGVSTQLRIRQTTVAGTLKVASGALTAVAANLVARSIVGFDSAPADGQIYKLTLEVALGSAVSTVSAVSLVAIPI